MSEPFTPDDSKDLDRLLEAFENQWRNGSPPELDRFLAGLSPGARQEILADLLELDQEYRWKQILSEDETQTQPVFLKEYLQCYPELGSITQLNSSLIVREFQGRLATGEGITLSQFVAEYDLTDEALIKRLEKVVLEQQASLPPSIPGYDRIKPLGKGGMGVVYRARQKRMKRSVAIKLIPAHLNNNMDLRKRFEREMQAAAALNHSHIVTAYHADEYQQMLYLVSELADGQDLSTVIKKQGPFSVERAVSVILQIAEGLSHAHQRGVIHRDIKPGNLIYHQQKNFAQVLDFGLAKFRDQSDLEDDTSSLSHDLTSTGAIMGTVNYMAPEQALDTKAADERSDIYSLGCVLHFLLTGEPPFRGSSMMSMLLAHREQPIPDLTDIRSEIPAEVNSIFSRMIAKDPGDRYATMEEVISAFSALNISLDEEEPTLISQEKNTPVTEELVNATTVIMPKPVRSQRRNVFLAIGVLGFLGFFGFAFQKSWKGDSAPSPESALIADSSPVQSSLSPEPAAEKTSETVPTQTPAADDDELPSLNEWLKGRKILTVAQDGTGQFTSIQEACRALKEGQAVEILDQGPYRETLRLGKLPANTGLVSRVGTVLALDTIHDNSIHKGRFSGHGINNIKGFRLSGIYFSRGGHRRDTDLINIGPGEDLIVDNCVFEAPPSLAFDNTYRYKKRHYSYSLTVNGSKTIQIRHCIMGSSAAFYIADQTQLSIKHNWFQPGLLSQLDIGTYRDEIKEYCQIEIETNVFSKTGYRSIAHQLPKKSNLNLSIQQNTFFGGEAIGFIRDFPQHPVKIDNNVFLKNTQPLWFSENAKTVFGDLPDKWSITDNIHFNDHYTSRLSLLTKDGNNKIQTSSYIASLNDPAHYLRYKLLNAADTVPAVCGAFPPGPAPPEGDWLTKLIGRWNFARPFISEAETEDLEDWLAGRTIRTVSQDGQGEFKSIQAALEALQPGEVVEVLDQGPYPEKIKLVRPMPEDTGIFSKVGTVVETPEWSTLTNSRGQKMIQGHSFALEGTFRLQGFDFEMAQAPPDAVLVNIYAIPTKRPRRVVIKDCVFQTPENVPSSLLKGLTMTSAGETHITNNLFASPAVIYACGNTILTVDQNWFLGGGHSQLAVASYQDQNPQQKLVIIAENVFDSAEETALGLSEEGSINQTTKIFHNTFINGGRQPLSIRNGFEQRITEIYQNLFLTDHDPLAFGPKTHPDQASIKAHWLVEQNVYSKRPGSRYISIEETIEIVDNVSVLSETRDSPEYLHIADESQLAGATDQPEEWLPVIGALMPDSVSADNDWFSDLQAKWTKLGKKP
jgi:serine/threonine protein kinase